MIALKITKKRHSMMHRNMLCCTVLRYDALSYIVIRWNNKTHSFEIESYCVKNLAQIKMWCIEANHSATSCWCLIYVLLATAMLRLTHYNWSSNALKQDHLKVWQNLILILPKKSQSCHLCDSTWVVLFIRN